MMTYDNDDDDMEEDRTGSKPGAHLGGKHGSRAPTPPQKKMKFHVDISAFGRRLKGSAMSFVCPRVYGEFLSAA